MGSERSDDDVLNGDGQAVRQVLDTLLDPHLVFEPVRDGDGRIVDFAYVEANRAACLYANVAREDIIGKRTLELYPGHIGSALFDMYASAYESGEPLILDDFRIPAEVIEDDRYADVRVVRVGDRLHYTLRDTTGRHLAVEQLAQSEERLRASLNAMLDPSVLISAVRDDSGRITDFRHIDANSAACAYLSTTRERLLGSTMKAVMPSLVECGIFDTYVDAMQTSKPVVLNDFHLTDVSRGIDQWLDVRGGRIDDGLVITWRDVTRRHWTTLRLAESEERYRLLAENSTDVIVRTRGGVISWISPSISDVLGGSPSNWAGLRLTDLIHPSDLDPFTLEQPHIDGGEGVVSRHRIRATNGTYHWIEMHARLFRGAEGEPDGQIASWRLVDDLVSAEAELDRRARFDALTGLLNRNEILDRVATITSRSPRTGSESAVLFCDIDAFKGINDTHGHAAGDTVLRTLAERVGSCVRQDDYAARIGGDELLVVLSGVHTLEEATAVAEKIRNAASEPIDLSGFPITVTLSIGVTLAQPGESSDDLVARADEAMYRAKQNGRDQVVAI